MIGRMPAVNDAALRRLAARVAKRLRAAGETIVTAESCTGGFLAKCLTDLPGSSDYFDRGWVAYSNYAKRVELDVDPRTLARYGAVSEAVALAMVRGALDAATAQHAVAVTGIAGPAGGRRGKPVGLVWIAWGYQTGDWNCIHANAYQFRGSRDTIRRRSVAAALAGLLEP
jgi:nicotinamide-nucleotide amidase